MEHCTTEAELQTISDYRLQTHHNSKCTTKLPRLPYSSPPSITNFEPEKSGPFFGHKTVQLAGFQKGGIPPFAMGFEVGSTPSLANFLRINEIHRWPEMPQMESWYFVPPEKSQVAGVPCAKLQVELFSLPV